jgi:hypothetical protein
LIILEWLIGVEELLLLSSFSGFLFQAQSFFLGHPCGYNERVFIHFGAVLGSIKVRRDTTAEKETTLLWV